LSLVHTSFSQLAHQQQQAAAPIGAGGGFGGAGAIDLATLRNNPQIAQLRQLIAQNPEMIQPIIQQLAATNPAIATALAANPELLLHLLGGQGEGQDDGEYGEGDEELPPGTHIVSVTEEERAAIERVSSRRQQIHL
jgi:UV excision repair protein RAD23